MTTKKLPKHISTPGRVNWIMCVMIIWSASACQKFLDLKPDKSITTIQSIKDLQAILDEPITVSSLPTAAADEYYLTEDFFNASPQEIRNIYAWVEPLSDGWNNAYTNVYYANVILQELDKVDASANDKDFIRGQALFRRAFSFFQVAQLFCKPYSETAAFDPGIALRLLPDIESKTTRATVKQTYDQIVADLTEAAGLLPENEVASNRADKINAYGLLARVYLSMREYPKAKEFSALYLDRLDELIDYNTLDTMLDPPFDKFHVENSFFARADGAIPDYSAIIDSGLLALYAEGDLRKPLFFAKNDDGTIRFKGSYGGMVGYIPYAGIATDEIYLIRAECNARLGNVNEALADVNTLLVKRWKEGDFVPRAAANKEEALQLVLNERRKELVFRGTRWSDIRRLNLEGAGITFVRKVGTTTFTLPPNDKKWVWLIPREVIAIAGIAQNER